MEPVDDWTSEEVARLENVLREVARALVRHPDEQDDLVQDSWIAILRRPRSRVRDPHSFAQEVARFRARRLALRRRRRSESEALSARGEAQPAGELDPEYSSTEALLHAEIEELAEPYHTVVRLRYYERLEIPEIAARLARSNNTVKSQLRRGLEKLRERLDRRYGGSREAWTALFVRVFGRSSESATAEPGELAPAGAAASSSSFAWLWLLPVAATLLLVGALSLRRDAPIVEPSVAFAPPGDPRTGAVAAEGPARDPLANAAAAAEQPEAGRSVATSAAALERAVDARVVDESGTPVEGVELRIGPSAEPRLGAITGPDGRARVEILEADLGTTSETQWRDHVPLVAKGPGRACSDIAIVRLREPRVMPLEFQLFTRITRLKGHLLEQGTRRPIAGATIRVQRGGKDIRIEDETTSWVGVSRTAVSTADGSFSIDVARGPYQLGVVIDGVERATGLYDTGARDEVKFEFLLPATGELAGHVLALDGWPLAGARVRCRPGGKRVFETTCSEDGSFRLRGLEAGSFRFEAQAAEDPALVAIAEIEIAAGATAGWTAQLERRAGLRFRLESPEGDPLAGWFVYVAPDDLSSDWVLEATTDGEGRVARYEQPEGSFHLFAWRDPSSEPVPRRVVRGLHAETDEQVIVVEPGVPPGGAIAGAVLDAADQPPGEADLELLPLAAPTPSRLPLAHDGTFRTAHLPAGSYRILLHKSRQGWAVFGPFTVEAGVDLELGTLRAPGTGTLVIDWRWPATALDNYQIHRLDEHEGLQRLGVGSDHGNRTTAGPQPLLAGPYLLRILEGSKLREEQTFWIESGRETRVVVGPEPLFVVHVRLAGLGSDARLSAIDASGRVVREERPEIAADGRGELSTELAPGTWTLRVRDLHGASGEAVVELDPRRPIKSVEIEAR